jgi:hypothetical protein
MYSHNAGLTAWLMEEEEEGSEESILSIFRPSHTRKQSISNMFGKKH